MSDNPVSDDENLTSFQTSECPASNSDLSPSGVSENSNFSNFGSEQEEHSDIEAGLAKKLQSERSGRRNSAPIIPVFAVMPEASRRRKSWSAGDKPSRLAMRRGSPPLSVLIPPPDIEIHHRIIDSFDSQLKKLEDNALTMLLAVSMILLAFIWSKMPAGALQNCLAGFAFACLSMQCLTTSQLLTVLKDSKKGYASHILVVMGGLVVANACAVDGARHALDIFSHEMRLFLLICIFYLTFVASNMISIRWGRGLVKLRGSELKESKHESAPLLSAATAHKRILHRSRDMFLVAVLSVAVLLGYLLLHTYPDLYTWQVLCCIGQLFAALASWQLEQDLMVGVYSDDNWRAATIEMFFTAILVASALLFNLIGFYMQAHVLLVDRPKPFLQNVVSFKGDHATTPDYAPTVWLRWTICFGTLCLVDSVGGLSRLCGQIRVSESFIMESIGELPKLP